jgi:hypothetical protein
MDKPSFVIPTQVTFWSRGSATTTSTLSEREWAEREAGRVLAMVSLLFPDVAFELAKTPPRSQTYEPGTRNAEILSFLQDRTLIRLGPTRP